MANRETLLFLAQILDQTDRHEDMIEAMKKIIELDADLSGDERNLLSVAYKNVVGGKRNALRMIAAIIENEEGRGNAERVEQLKKYRATILGELQGVCNELTGVVDGKLLPAAKGADAKVFYEKLKADYYRYVSESTPGPEKAESSAKAKACYESAMAIAKAEIAPSRPTSLGLILNYSVFLYEILGNKSEAIELAQKTYNECSTTVDENSDTSYSEATMILQLLRDNVTLWTQESDAA